MKPSTVWDHAAPLPASEGRAEATGKAAVSSLQRRPGPAGRGAAPSLSDAPGRSSRGPGVAGHLRGCPETRTKQKVGGAPARTRDAKSELWGAGGELNGVSDFGRRGPRRSTPRRGAPARSPARPGGGGGVLRAEGAPVTLSPRRPG